MDDKLSRALQSLPRERARPGFNRRLLRRLDQGRPLEARRTWRPAVVAACLLALVAGGREWWAHHQTRQGLARLEQMKDERRALVGELEALQSQVARARPVVYLGGSNDVDLVLDLAQLHRAEGGARSHSPADLRAIETTIARILESRTPVGRTPDGRTPVGRTPDIRPASFPTDRPTIY